MWKIIPNIWPWDFQISIICFNNEFRVENTHIPLQKCLYGISPLQFRYLIFKSVKCSLALKVNEKRRCSNRTWVFVYGLQHNFFANSSSLLHIFYSWIFLLQTRNAKFKVAEKKKRFFCLFYFSVINIPP